MSAPKLRGARLADRVLRATLRSERAAEITDELRERAEERLARGDARGAVTRWYVRQVISLVLHYAAGRSRRRSSVDPGRARLRVGPGWSSAMLTDLRHGIRTLAGRPAFSLLVIVALALGIGANTAVFTVVRNVLLRPLPYPDPDRVVALWMEFRRDADVPGVEIVASEPEYLEFAAAATSFEGIAGFWTGRTNLLGADEPVRVPSAAVSANFFQVIGVRPAIGRGFLSGEDGPDAPRVAILSDGLWTRAYGRDPNLVGRTVVADGRSYEIVGILPPTFRFPGDQVDFLRTNVIDPANPGGRSSHYLRMIGRLKPDVAIAAGRTEARLLNARFEAAQPGLHGLASRHPIVIASLHERMVGPLRAGLGLLMGAAALVLLIACANVANLMYARSESRGRELAIRQAMGAERSRLVSHLLAEGLLLSAGGAAVGLAISVVAVPVLLRARGADLGGVVASGIDPWVVLFAIGMGLLSAVAFSLAPSLGATRRRRLTLQERGATGDPARSRIRNGLLITQIAVAVMLLIGAGVLTRNLIALLQVDPGFDPDGVVSMTFALDASRYRSAESVADFHRRLDQRLAAAPAVIDVGAIRTLPLTSEGSFETLTVSGGREEQHGINAVYQVASPGYFRALSVPLIRGRMIEETDGASAPPVVVINRAMAMRFWPDGDPVGNTIQLGAMDDNPNPVMTIVGVIGDVIQADLGGGPTPQIFAPRAQAGANYGGLGTRDASLAVKGTGDPAPLIALVRSVFRELDPAVPLSNIRTLESVVTASVTEERFLSLMLGIFSSVALVLAAIGVYGLMAYLVVQRTREIGVRIALGADRHSVIRGVVSRGLTLSLAGVAIGVATAWLGGRLLESFVSLGSARDPLVFATGPVVLLLAATLAAYGPARRAAAVDPIEALRAD